MQSCHIHCHRKRRLLLVLITLNYLRREATAHRSDHLIRISLGPVVHVTWHSALHCCLNRCNSLVGGGVSRFLFYTVKLRCALTAEVRGIGRWRFAQFDRLALNSGSEHVLIVIGQKKPTSNSSTFGDCAEERTAARPIRAHYTEDNYHYRSIITKKWTISNISYPELISF